MKNKNIVLVLLAIICILIVLSFQLPEKEVIEVKSLEMRVNVSDSGIGFNNEENNLNFGVVPKKGSSKKKIRLSQNDFDTLNGEIKISGDMKKWVDVSERKFELKKNHTRTIAFTLNVPENINTGLYEGNASIIMYK